MWTSKRKSGKVEHLVEKSKSIISVFENTRIELEDVNNEISEVIVNKQDEISALQTEVSVLNKVSANNFAIATKITQFLNT